jgi:hypothetical protein
MPPIPSAKYRDPGLPTDLLGVLCVKKLLGIVGAVIATLLGLAVLVSVLAVVLLNSGALNGLIEEAIAAEVRRPARLEQAPSLGFEDGA